MADNKAKTDFFTCIKVSAILTTTADITAAYQIIKFQQKQNIFGNLFESLKAFCSSDKLDAVQRIGITKHNVRLQLPFFVFQSGTVIEYV